MSHRPEFNYFTAEKLDQLLRPLGHSLDQPRELARTVKKLSDFYIMQPAAATPWHDPETQVAYLVYYLPLGMLRWSSVLREVRRFDFLRGIKTFVDYGSGPGTAGLVIGQEFTEGAGVAIERARLATEFHQRIFQHAPFPKPARMNYHTDTVLRVAQDPSSSVLLLSYVLTELEALPENWDAFRAVIVMEPSTQDDGRRLMAWRSECIAQGFHLWAPCVHQLDCPLLIHSKKDWCHDRVTWERPAWWRDMEKFLPFKNQTATYSYLMLSRTPPPKSLSAVAAAESVGRLVGDPLIEKGKTRQMICRKDAREFLSWLHKAGEVPDYPRGELLGLEEIAPKGAEIRAQTSYFKV